MGYASFKVEGILRMLSAYDYFDIPISILKAKLLRGLDIAPRPRVIAYSVTWRCNAGCEMCGIKNVDNSLKVREKELTANDISRIFKDPLLKKLDLIRFTGGEPFLKEDFPDIVEEIAKNTDTKIYYITTNGFFTERILDFTKRLAPKIKNLVIQVSLDGTRERHDDIRKLPGLYDKVVETLKGLKNLKESLSFSFGINQTITEDTVKDVAKIAELSEELGCDHKLYMAHEAHESDILEGENLTGSPVLLSNPDRIIVEKLYNKIDEHYNRRRGKKSKLISPEILWNVIEKRVLEGSKNRNLKGRNLPNPPCLACSLYVRLLPDGKLMPCTLKPRAIGDLKESTFSTIWDSKAAKNMREEVRNCRGCWVECDIVPNLIYSFGITGDIVKELLSFKAR